MEARVLAEARNENRRRRAEARVFREGHRALHRDLVTNVRALIRRQPVSGFR
jgi:hypothetical protein